MSDKFRASFSVLNLWSQGREEEATKAYFKLERFESEQMKAGKKFHEEWKEETLKTGCVPALFGGEKLDNPIVEEKLVVQLDDWLELVFVIDCQDSKRILEYKTGLTDAAGYASSFQLPIYDLGCEMMGVSHEFGDIHTWNQYTKEASFARIWFTKQSRLNALNWLVTNAGLMHEYFTQNDLYEKIGRRK